MTVYFIFVIWVFINEGLRGMAAIKRSKELVKGYWWATVGRSLLPAIVIWTVVIISAVFVKPDTNEQVVYDFVNQVISLLATPFLLAYSYYMYKSLLKIKNSEKNI